MCHSCGGRPDTAVLTLPYDRSKIKFIFIKPTNIIQEKFQALDCRVDHDPEFHISYAQPLEIHVINIRFCGHHMKIRIHPMRCSE